MALFDSKTQSVSELFTEKGGVAKYYIPKYQRPYAWKKKEVEKLWYGILDAYQNYRADEDGKVDENYFLGSIVVVRDKNKFEVVDGQQRLTTLTVLFYVLQNLVDSLELDKKKQRINRCLVNDNGERILEPNPYASKDFFNAFNDGIDFKKKLPKNLFFENAQKFKKLIEETEIEDFSDFVEYILDKVAIVSITCEDLSSALKLFTILNTTGVPLTSSDIIKSHLLSNSPENEKENFLTEWDRIVEKTKEKEKLEDVFQYYLYNLTGDGTKTVLQEEFKRQLDKSPNEKGIIYDISAFLDNLIAINEDADKSKDKFIFMLRYLPHSYWKIILATAKHNGYENFDDLKELLAKYYYQVWILNGTATVKTPAFHILRAVKDHSSIENIKTIIKDHLSRFGDYNQQLGRDDVYTKTKWLRPILAALEYNRVEKRDYITIDKDLAAEHILPKEFDAHWGNKLNEEDKQNAEKFKNCLGNFVLLSRSKNSSANNKSLDEKISVYSGKKNNDGMTSYYITQEIIKDYQKDWTPETIKTRREEMIAEIEKILEIV